jgi:hypothetical protein
MKADNIFDPQVAAETMRGDIRDAVLTEFKQMAKPWQAMTEDEQQRVINRAVDIADDLVRKAVDLIAARGLPALPITVGKITVESSECKGTFECFADDEALLRIRHLQGSRAMFVLASPDAYQGETGKAEPENVGDLAIPKDNLEGIETLGRGKSKSNGAAAHG